MRLLISLCLLLMTALALLREERTVVVVREPAPAGAVVTARGTDYQLLSAVALGGYLQRCDRSPGLPARGPVLAGSREQEAGSRGRDLHLWLLRASLGFPGERRDPALPCLRRGHGLCKIRLTLCISNCTLGP